MPILPSDVGAFFLVGVLFTPTEAERIEGKKKTIAVSPQFILADDAAAAANKAIMLTPRDLDPDRCEVFVTKPF